jgi:glycosyltransferase involved in cell wall biosynthesis
VIYTPENPEFPQADASLFNDIPEGVEVIKRPIWEPYNAYKRFIGQKKEDKIQAGFISEKKKKPIFEDISVWIRGNLFIPDARKFWIRPSIHFLTEYLSAHPVNAIVSTGPPHSMHLIALGVKEKLNLPWLADFRDPWTGIDFYHQLRLTRRADSRHHQLENSVLKTADSITTVSRNIADDLRKLYPRDYEVVTNGFDPDDFIIPDQEVSPDFEITHVGSLNKDRNPELLWETINEICSENPEFNRDLRLRFIGKCDVSLFQSLEKFNLITKTTKTEYLPHDEVLRESARSQVLLLPLNNTPNVKGIVTGKMFEYLATRRPILCIGPPDGDCARIISESDAGITCDFNDKTSMKVALAQLYEKYRQGLLTKSTGNIDAFSRKGLTARISSILNKITDPES